MQPTVSSFTPLYIVIKFAFLTVSPIGSSTGDHETALHACAFVRDMKAGAYRSIWDS